MKYFIVSIATTSSRVSPHFFASTMVEGDVSMYVHHRLQTYLLLLARHCCMEVFQDFEWCFDARPNVISFEENRMNGKYDCRIFLNMYLDQVSALSERS